MLFLRFMLAGGSLVVLATPRLRESALLGAPIVLAALEVFRVTRVALADPTPAEAPPRDVSITTRELVIETAKFADSVPEHIKLSRAQLRFFARLLAELPEPDRADEDPAYREGWQGARHVAALVLGAMTSDPFAGVGARLDRPHDLH